MPELITKAMARNIFYGGSLFFLAVFVVLSVHSHLHIVRVSTAYAELTESVALGKRVWEREACVNCHTILGEGAYFAPEVGNVMARWDVADEPDDAFETLKVWFVSQPSGIVGRRQMPRFDLPDHEIRALSDFLLWTNRIRTQGWPPNDAG